MKSFALALPLFLWAASAAVADGDLPRTMSLNDERRERQDLETERQRPDQYPELTPMEFFYRYSELEAGVMYTDFSNDLSLKSHLGFYVRYGVQILPNISVNLTYRYNEFGNGPSAGSEDVRLQSLFAGACLRVPLHPEFQFIAGAGVGRMWWDSSVSKNDIGVGLTAEAALTARIWEVLRFKAGLVLDGVNTDFHQTSASWSVNLSYLVGIEIGAPAR